jgi:hypothetical protein
MWDGRVPPKQQPVKVQGAKFKTTEIPQLKFFKHTSISHHFKDKCCKSSQCVRFQKGFTTKAHQTIMLGQYLVTEKHSHFSSQREESQKAEIEIK